MVWDLELSRAETPASLAEDTAPTMDIITTTLRTVEATEVATVDLLLRRSSERITPATTTMIEETTKITTRNETVLSQNLLNARILVTDSPPTGIRRILLTAVVEEEEVELTLSGEHLHNTRTGHKTREIGQIGQTVIKMPRTFLQGLTE